MNCQYVWVKKYVCIEEEILDIFFKFTLILTNSYVKIGTCIRSLRELGRL